MTNFNQNTPYENLSPSLVMYAVETLGYVCTGSVFALNSYENRVYDIEIEGEENPNIIAKFYRPNRWSRDQIQEEHAFADEMQTAEVDVVPPLKFNGKTLFEYEGYLFCIYPKRVGKPIELTTDEDYRHMGRLVARMHAVGIQKMFKNRIELTPQKYGWNNLSFFKNEGKVLVPEHLEQAYVSTVTHLLEKIDTIWGERKFNCRIHGDCHWGNIFKNTDVFFVDLDDCLTGPEVQDLWMMVSGEKEDRNRQFNLILEGYEQIRDFDYSQLELVESLRALRMIHMVAWVGKRWQDPAFKLRFADFSTANYWQTHILDLKEQIATIDGYN